MRSPSSSAYAETRTYYPGDPCGRLSVVKHRQLARQVGAFSEFASESSKDLINKIKLVVAISEVCRSPTRSWRATLLSQKLVESEKKTARGVADRCMVNHDGPRCRPVQIRGNTKTEAEDYNSNLSTRVKSCSHSLPSTRLKRNQDRVLHRLNMFHLLKATMRSCCGGHATLDQIAMCVW